MRQPVGNVQGVQTSGCGLTAAAQKIPAAATTHSDARNPPLRNPMAAHPGNDHQVDTAIHTTEAHHSQVCCGRGVQIVARTRP